MTVARNGRARAAITSVQAPVRCAVYCRKSTDEGLDKDFNSLDAQREACENYIASMRAENWIALPSTYSDGGFSGGNVNRPALQQLLRDVEAGEVDCVVVYKYDRLSRSMLDFLQLLDSFKRRGVSFVSVSQRFDTSTPVGEMTLNILLSFAQFERQIIAERTRDKIRAARRRGRWTGGRPPLGYDTAPEGGRLIVNRDEAEVVKAIFTLFIETPSLIGLVEELRRRGWTTRTGKPWNRVTLKTLLTNPLYVGLQKLGDETFAGEHQAILPRKLFDQVQRVFAENRTSRRSTSLGGTGFLLRGLIRCASCEAAMVPSPAKSRGKLYRYYRCHHAERAGHAACPSKMINADRVEQFVVDQVRRIGADQALQEETFRQAVAQVKAQRRGLQAERKRLERDLDAARNDVERLVDAVVAVTGPARDAVANQLNTGQEHIQTVEARLREIDEELTALKAQEVDRDEVAQALAEFDPVWDVLLVHERERVLKLLVDRIDYDGGTGQLIIQWRLPGFTELAAEVAS